MTTPDFYQFMSCFLALLLACMCRSIHTQTLDLVTLNLLLWENWTEESWLSRSLFVIGGHVLVCVEDIIQFSSHLNDACSPPYFSLDSCCNITDVSEMVTSLVFLSCILQLIYYFGTEIICCCNSHHCSR